MRGFGFVWLQWPVKDPEMRSAAEAVWGADGASKAGSATRTLLLGVGKVAGADSEIGESLVDGLLQMMRFSKNRVDGPFQNAVFSIEGRARPSGVTGEI